MGILVALEGIDGSGKSTQALALRDRLQTEGFRAVVYREPGDTEYGDKLREIFKHGRSVSPEEEMRLFLEDRRIDVRDNIQPALDSGQVVIMDRYYFSSMAYQGALGLDPEQIRAANEAFAPRPRLTVVLDVAPQASTRRILAARGTQDSFEGVEYLEKVRALFLSFVSDDVVTIDATGTFEEVQELLWEKVAALVKQENGGNA
jgi:dTMP kinase